MASCRNLRGVVFTRLLRPIGRPVGTGAVLIEPGPDGGNALLQHMLLGVFYGAALMIVLVNLYLGLQDRSRLRFWWHLYLLALMLDTKGIHVFVLQSIAPGTPAIAGAIKGIILGSVMVAEMLFILELFGMRRDARRSGESGSRRIALLCIACGAGAVLSLAGSTSLAAIITQAMELLLAIVAVWLAIRRNGEGDSAAHWYLAGFAAIGAGTLLAAARNFGLIPATASIEPLWQATLIMHLGLLTIGVFNSHLNASRKTQNAGLLNLHARSEIELTRMQQRLVSLVSHECRSALAVIDATLFSLKRLSRGLAPEILSRYDKIGRARYRLQSLVDNYLSVEMMNRPTLSLRESPEDFAALVDEVLRDARSASPHHKIVLGTRRMPKLVMMDRESIRLMLSNLISNAIKYSPVKGVVVVSLNFEGPEMHLRVRDNGIGIAPDDVPHIFEKNFRGGHSLNGSGLGLHLVKQIVDLHGGTITVDSTAGVGTTMRVWISFNRSVNLEGSKFDELV